MKTQGNHPAPGPDDRPVIVHVLHTLNAAGAEVLVRDLAAATEDRYRTIVVALDSDGPLRTAFEARGVEVHVLRRRPGVDWSCATRIASIARRRRASIIHAHQYTPFFYAALARLAGARRCRLVFTEHGRHYPDRRRTKRVLANRLLVRLAHRITAVGESVADKLIRNEGIPRRRIAVIHNGVDPDRFPTLDACERNTLRASIGVAPEATLILHVAGFRPVKDHPTALRAFARLAARDPDAVLAFAGTGPGQPDAERLAESLGIADRVRFLGARDDVPRLWAAADIALLTSFSEGVSVAALEAMASRRPMVATNVGGNGEVVAHGETGFLAPREDDAAIAEALARLAASPTLRARMGRAARHRLNARFTQRAMHEAFDRLYRSLPPHARRPTKDDDPAPIERVLLVFADDYGRHPSSTQHIVNRLPATWRVVWVNTIGTRRPRLCRADIRRAWGKVQQWRARRGGESSASAARTETPPNVRAINPPMWPSFHTPLARRLNRWMMARAIRPALEQAVAEAPAASPPPPVSALTALPVTADLVGRLPVDNWVYYMVDDFGAWPGLDGEAMRLMDARQLDAVDRVAAVSEPLARRAEAHRRRVARITHGVDLEHWRADRVDADDNHDHDRCHPLAQSLRSSDRPTAVFWGLIDARLDVEAVESLCAQWRGRVLLVGPTQGEPDRLAAIEGVELTGPVPYATLPKIAAAADVLIMPYAATAATRAMQPLKLMEYLATDRPVVCLALPSTRAWADAADVVTRGAFAERVRLRAVEGLPAGQREARRRLAAESWAAKADAMRRLIEGGEAIAIGSPPPPNARAA